MKRRCVLLRVEEDEAEVVGDDPLEGGKVQRAAKARDGGDVVLFAKKSHTYIIPQLRRVGRLLRGDAVLTERNVKVVVILDDRARR